MSNVINDLNEKMSSSFFTVNKEIMKYIYSNLNHEESVSGILISNL